MPPPTHTLSQLNTTSSIFGNCFFLFLLLQSDIQVLQMITFAAQGVIFEGASLFLFDIYAYNININNLGHQPINRKTTTKKFPKHQLHPEN